MRGERILFRFSVADAEAIAGRELDDATLNRIADTIANTNIGDAFVDIVHQFSGDAD